MEARTRPLQATVYSGLLVVSAICMLLLGMNASAYYIPALCLFLLAFLLWNGRGFKLFERLLTLNQLTAIVLILVLWLGDRLHLPKLDIAGVMLIANLVSGGPLAGILALPILGTLHFGKTLKGWFHPAHA